jgi:hypothetical protein
MDEREDAAKAYASTARDNSMRLMEKMTRAARGNVPPSVAPTAREKWAMAQLLVCLSPPASAIMCGRAPRGDVALVDCGDEVTDCMIIAFEDAEAMMRLAPLVCLSEPRHRGEWQSRAYCIAPRMAVGGEEAAALAEAGYGVLRVGFWREFRFVSTESLWSPAQYRASCIRDLDSQRINDAILANLMHPRHLWRRRDDGRCWWCYCDLRCVKHAKTCDCGLRMCDACPEHTCMSHEMCLSAWWALRVEAAGLDEAVELSRGVDRSRDAARAPPPPPRGATKLRLMVTGEMFFDDAFKSRLLIVPMRAALVVPGVATDESAAHHLRADHWKARLTFDVRKGDVARTPFGEFVFTEDCAAVDGLVKHVRRKASGDAPPRWSFC